MASRSSGWSTSATKSLAPAPTRRRAANGNDYSRRMPKEHGSHMLNLLLRAFVIALGTIGHAMAQERILISSDWGKVDAELVDNEAARSLAQMLPLIIEMRDHLRQEKT